MISSQAFIIHPKTERSRSAYRYITEFVVFTAGIIGKQGEAKPRLNHSDSGLISIHEKEFGRVEGGGCAYLDLQDRGRQSVRLSGDHRSLKFVKRQGTAARVRVFRSAYTGNRPSAQLMEKTKGLFRLLVAEGKHHVKPSLVQ